MAMHHIRIVWSLLKRNIGGIIIKLWFMDQCHGFISVMSLKGVNEMTEIFRSSTIHISQSFFVFLFSFKIDRIKSGETL